MELYFAPMEGITGARYRQAHRACFGGTDRYYLPFLSPTRDHLFTPRELRQVSPEDNARLEAVPQLLTREPADFLWAARALGEMGYGEVNLNLGCPSGTVVAKGKGAGLLADLPALERLLEGIFSGDLGGTRVSVKTRMGMVSPVEFGPLPSRCSSSTPGCGRTITGTRYAGGNFWTFCLRSAFLGAGTAE